MGELPSSNGSAAEQIEHSLAAVTAKELFGRLGQSCSHKEHYLQASARAFSQAMQDDHPPLHLVKRIVELLLQQPDASPVPEGLKGDQIIINTYFGGQLVQLVGWLLHHRHGTGGILRWQHPTVEREEAQHRFRIALCVVISEKPRPLVLLDTSSTPAVSIGVPTHVYLHALTRPGAGQFDLPGGGHLEHGVTLVGEGITYRNFTALVGVRLFALLCAAGHMEGRRQQAAPAALRNQKAAPTTCIIQQAAGRMQLCGCTRRATGAGLYLKQHDCVAGNAFVCSSIVEATQQKMRCAALLLRARACSGSW
jgi:hypothetical protein